MDSVAEPTPMTGNSNWSILHAVSLPQSRGRVQHPFPTTSPFEKIERNGSVNGKPDLPLGHGPLPPRRGGDRGVPRRRGDGKEDGLASQPPPQPPRRWSEALRPIVHCNPRPCLRGQGTSWPLILLLFYSFCCCCCCFFFSLELWSLGPSCQHKVLSGIGGQVGGPLYQIWITRGSSKSGQRFCRQTRIYHPFSLAMSATC